MNWASNQDEPADNLLNDFSRTSNQNADFSPLVNGLLSNATTPAVAGEWPLPHVTRNVRNDFRYEFSLSAHPEFDTESADGDEHIKMEDDKVSTDGNQAISEDTSIGVSMGSPKEFADQEDATKATSRGVSPVPIVVSSLQHDNKSNINTHMINIVNHTSDATNGGADSRPVSSSKAPLMPKTSKAIQKRKSGLAAKKPIGKNQSVRTGPATMSGSTSMGTNSAPSHTKMCRDRLNNMFEQLRHTLPPAPAGVEVKHKAQVLEYAIGVLKSMVERTSQLEIELAVSSNKATMDWISKLVNRVETFPEAAKEVMGLFSRRRGWKHAELWVAQKRPVENGGDPEDSTVLTFCMGVANEGMRYDGIDLDQFSKDSETYAFRSNEGVQGRVWSSMRPEWVTGLTNVQKFRRARLASKYGLKACLAVPVTITGKIEAVMCFYDIKHRPFDVQCVELAMRLAWALGNAVGGKRAKVHVLSTSGTSKT